MTVLYILIGGCIFLSFIAIFLCLILFAKIDNVEADIEFLKHLMEKRLTIIRWETMRIKQELKRIKKKHKKK